MKSVDKDTHDSTGQPTTGNWVGWVACFLGVVVVAVGSGVIETDANSWHSPKWMGILAGLVFLLAGIMILGKNKFRSRTNDLFGAAILTIFVIVTSWISFGPGEREFSGMSGDPTVGRLFFGIASALLGIFTWIAWRKLFQK